MFTDTHSHIYEPEFDEDREEVIQRAKEAGVERIFLPNINKESIGPMLQLCEKHPGYLFPMMGLHPEDVKENYQEILANMHQQFLTPHHPFIAVGEVGLDFYWDRTYEQEQREAFREQASWALDFHLPLMIHCRSAHRDLVDTLQALLTSNEFGKKLRTPSQTPLLRGIFHCFGGTPEEAAELLQFEGFALGIGGVLTYKKSTLPETLKSVPLNRIVVETDAPYLSPVPHRGKRNEPAFAIHTVRKLAEIYAVSEHEVMEETNMNVKRIFGC